MHLESALKLQPDNRACITAASPGAEISTSNREVDGLTSAPGSKMKFYM